MAGAGEGSGADIVGRTREGKRWIEDLSMKQKSRSDEHDSESGGTATNKSTTRLHELQAALSVIRVVGERHVRLRASMLRVEADDTKSRAARVQHVRVLKAIQ